VGIKKLSYLDLSAEKRRVAASDFRVHLRAALNNPATPEEQKMVVRDRLLQLEAWAAGKLPLDTVLETSGKTQVVQLNETIKVSENA
jgi:hypothetical protein